MTSPSNTLRITVGLTASLLLLLFIVGYGNAREISAELPAGFRTLSIATNLNNPTDFAFLPDNSIFVTQLGDGVDEAGFADLLLIENGIVRPAPVLTLSIMRRQDSGLLAITLDPNFENNGWFYLWYAPGNAANEWDGTRHLRLSRFTYDAATKTASPASELILLKSGSWEIWHHGNRLLFDSTGNLWVAVGEMTKTEPNSQDLSLLEGKILRIRPNENGYTIPADNPFVNDPNARPEIYASGLRNPYVMTQRQADGMLAVGDVGWAFYEEINIIEPGNNYGWPIREGICPYFQYDPCPPAPPEFTDPIIYWRHDEPPDDGFAAITGLTFYEGTQFPNTYNGQLFYADFVGRFIRVGNPDTGETQSFGNNMPLITRLREHQGLLYYASAFEGLIGAIYYEDGNNVAPSVTLTVDTNLGTPPHRVQFSVEATDPDDTLLTFRYDFGDGSPIVTTTNTEMVHVYSDDGRYEASVTAIDGRGAESLPAEETITVYSGELPSLFVENVTEPTRALYHAGDTVRYYLNRSSLDGLDPDTPYSWDIILHHGTHTHDFITNNTVISDTFSIPTANHDGSVDIWYAFHVTMLTDTGLEINLSKQIQPSVVDITFDTQPNTHRVQINGLTVNTPYTYPSIVGVENETIALPDLFLSPNIYAFDRWTSADGAVITTDASLLIPAPVTSQTYTANYVFDRRGFEQFMPLVRR